ncbi:MAG: hypothetical protein L0170_07250, partial [Acidobacteria bacterium]|nr:hypothetical protein [Acidobacteriota bacterium]
LKQALIGTLFAFVLVCVGIIVLRHTDPDRPRPFKTPWIPLLPIWLPLLWYLPSALRNAADWGGRLEIIVVLLLALVGAGFSLVALGAKLTGRRIPEVARTEFALAGIASCIWLMRGLPTITWWRFLGWLALGLMIYSLYGCRHSRLLAKSLPLPTRVSVLALVTLLVSTGLWIYLRRANPGPWSLALPILIIFGFSFYAISAVQRRST